MRERVFFPELPPTTFLLAAKPVGVSPAPFVPCPCPGHDWADENALCDSDALCAPWESLDRADQLFYERKEYGGRFPCGSCWGEGMVEERDFEFFAGIVKETKEKGNG